MRPWSSSLIVDTGPPGTQSIVQRDSDLWYHNCASDKIQAIVIDAKVHILVTNIHSVMGQRFNAFQPNMDDDTK